jgi:hypothetical protein
MRCCSAVSGLPIPLCPCSSASNCASHDARRLAQAHVTTHLPDTQALILDHLHDLELELRVERSALSAHQFLLDG